MQISGTTVGEIRVVESMHERKAIMFDEADAFISIPGGERRWCVLSCTAPGLYSPSACATALPGAVHWWSALQRLSGRIPDVVCERALWPACRLRRAGRDAGLWPLFSTLSDCERAAFLPAGYGTLDETLEITTWHQLGYHQKPGEAGAGATCAGIRKCTGRRGRACKHGQRSAGIIISTKRLRWLPPSCRPKVQTQPNRCCPALHPQSVS